jgi:hypothetical protein
MIHHWFPPLRLPCIVSETTTTDKAASVEKVTASTEENVTLQCVISPNVAAPSVCIYLVVPFCVGEHLELGLLRQVLADFRNGKDDLESRSENFLIS